MGKTAYWVVLNGPQAAISITIVYASFGWGVVFMERYKKRLIKHKPAMLLQAACKYIPGCKKTVQAVFQPFYGNRLT
jgi:hypothetical protein